MLTEEIVGLMTPRALVNHYRSLVTCSNLSLLTPQGEDVLKLVQAEVQRRLALFDDPDYAELVSPYEKSEAPDL